MKMTSRLISIAAVAIVLASCASSPGPGDEKAAKFSTLYTQAIAELRPKGVVCDVGIGLDNSGRFDLALEKATLDGQVKVAQAFEVKIEALKTKFVGSAGADSSAQLTETFSSAAKSAVKKSLNGIQPLSAPRSITTGKQIEVGIIMGIDPKLINGSFLEELKGADNKLYDRFRSSQAFDELKKEMDNYDKK